MGVVDEKAAGFSLHAGVASAAHAREQLQRSSRHIARPAVSIARLSLTPAGTMRYRLKTPCRDGTTDIVFEPLDVMVCSPPAAAGAHRSPRPDVAAIAVRHPPRRPQRLASTLPPRRGRSVSSACSTSMSQPVRAVADRGM
jgi:hypothetical protein